MSFSYDPALATTLDYVRFLLHDRISTAANPHFLEDEEILAVIAEQRQTVAAAVKYYAAAQCLTMLHTMWMTRGKGLASKKVSHLALVYGTGGGINTDLAVQAKISELRKKGAYELSKRPYCFSAP